MSTLNDIHYTKEPSVSEDGILLNTNLLPKLSYKILETKVVNFGSNKYPLNLYGSKDNYKLFPNKD